jgi:hypothetical protein
MKLPLPVALAAAWLAAGAVHADPATDAPAANRAVAADTNSAATNSTAEAAQPPAAAQTVTVASPPDGKGQVVFFRKKAFEGAAVWFKVRENGQELGQLNNGAYFVAVEDPGAHSFTAATENKDTLKLQVDPGETYYVEGRVTMGFFIGEANLSPSDSDTFQKDANHLKLASAPEKAPAAADKP